MALHRQWRPQAPPCCVLGRSRTGRYATLPASLPGEVWASPFPAQRHERHRRGSAPRREREPRGACGAGGEAGTLAARGVGLDDRQEGDRRDHRRVPRALRRPPHAGEPEGVPGARRRRSGDRQVRGVAADGGGAGISALEHPLGHPRHPHRGPRRSRRRDRGPRAPQPRGAPRRPSLPAAHPALLGGADHAADRLRRACIHRLPRPPVHDRDDRRHPDPRPGRLRERLLRVPEVVLRRDLRRGRRPPRPPPSPRDLERDAHRRVGQAEPQSHLPPHGDRRRNAGRGRFRRRADLGRRRLAPDPARERARDQPLPHGLPLMALELDAHIPAGPIDEKWHSWLDEHRLVGPRRRSDHRVIVVGTGLAGASAAATLADLGYRVRAFCFQDSARRAHSIAAQGGINATKDYANEGDSVRRLFADTIKGGDFRSREANVWRLAELSTNIIDQAVAQGVPFNREYGGLLATRSFGGVLVERTFYCRGQTGQQLLLGAYSALQQQINRGQAEMFTRHELMDVVLVGGRARGIIARNLVTGELAAHAADAVVLATGGYCNAYFLSTNAKGCNVTAIWRAHRRSAAMANPCFTQIHPTCIPESGEYQSKLTLMSESLRNDGRIWVPRDPDDERPPNELPDSDRYYYLEERYPRYGNLVPRDVASRAAKQACDDGLGVGPTARRVYLDFRDAIAERGREEIESRYGNLFELYERITGEDPWGVPMRIYPAPHYSMGGLWVDYRLQTTIPGLFAIGESNFSDHGANRLGASAMMQCLADGYFVVPHTVTHYLSGLDDHVDERDPAFAATKLDVEERIRRLTSVGGSTGAMHLHRELGHLKLDHW